MKVYYTIKKESRTIFLKYYIELYVDNFCWDRDFTFTLWGAKRKAKKMYIKYLDYKRPNIILKKELFGDDEK